MVFNELHVKNLNNMQKVGDINLLLYKTNQYIIKVHVQLKISITKNCSLVCYLVILALLLVGTSLPATIIQ